MPCLRDGDQRLITGHNPLTRESRESDVSGSQVQPWLQQQAAHGLTALSGAQQIGERHWRIDLCNPGDHEREQEISALQQGEQRKAEHAFCMVVHHDSSCTSAGSGNTRPGSRYLSQPQPRPSLPLPQSQRQRRLPRQPLLLRPRALRQHLQNYRISPGMRSTCRSSGNRSLAAWSRPPHGCCGSKVRTLFELSKHKDTIRDFSITDGDVDRGTHQPQPSPYPTG